MTVQDAVTGRPVPLGGAEVSYENSRQSLRTDRRPDADSSSRFAICCTAGAWRVRISKAGYVPFEATVPVRTTGRCDRPVLVYLVARLRPLALAQTAQIGVAPS